MYFVYFINLKKISYKGILMKIIKIFFALGIMCIYLQANNLNQMQISTHVLDITDGQPAKNVKIELYKMHNNQWLKLEEKFTNINGRISQILPNNINEIKGIYKLKFYTKDYFSTKKIATFFPFIEVAFEVNDDKQMHYHIPITLSPFGYSTYRGS